ncbi:hypothetical protein [Streptomyces sp. NPDC058861]|uniref:hypothetical protein n=1 Tax=Streptomyces sp. NPDC058861 TaxID=3346653 RepID=UPI0036C16EAA
MARNLFGGTAADVAEDIDGKRIPGAVGTVWDGPSETARQLVDLTDADGVPIIQLVADQRGFIPSFYGPSTDAERVWVDFGVGKISLVSVTVGDRLRDHSTSADPHQDRAYTEERLLGYVSRGGSEVTTPKDGSWLTVRTGADAGGSVISLVGQSTGTQYSRVKNNGSVWLDTYQKATPLCIGAPGYTASGTVINVVDAKATSTEANAVFQVKGDGSVISKGTVTATNVGSARVFSGPSAPASPRAGDVWVQYG